MWDTSLMHYRPIKVSDQWMDWCRSTTIRLSFLQWTLGYVNYCVPLLWRHNGCDRAQMTSNAENVSIWWRHHALSVDSELIALWVTIATTLQPMNIRTYPMLRADSRFWLVNNRELWRRISRLTSSAWDIKTKERHWWRHNGDSDRRPLSLRLRYDLVTLCLCSGLGQINVIAGILKLRKRFRMSQILFEHGINSLPHVCFRGYGNLSTLSIAIPRLAFVRAWYCDAACG